MKTYSFKNIFGKKFSLKFDKTLLMGILNVTPDSFSDAGKFFSAAMAVEQGVLMADAGSRACCRGRGEKKGAASY